MIIKDGTGTGKTLSITAENRARTDTVTRSLTQHINEEYEKHFSLTFDAIDPVGADDYFFYIKNTGTKTIHATKFRFRSTVAGSVELHRVTGTASFASETVITPVNRTLGSTNTVTAVTSADTNTTGISEAGIMLRMRLAVVDTDYVDEAPSHIIIPPGQAMACLWDTATGALSGTIDIYEDQGIL